MIGYCLLVHQFVVSFTQVKCKTSYVISKILNENSRKSVRWSAVPVPCLSRLWLKLRGEQGSGPEGVDDLCFHTYGGFSPSPSPPPPPPFPSPPQIPASRPKS